MMRNKLRWLPAIVVPALIAAGVVAAQASGDTELPERSPSEVLALAAGHSDASFSGTVEQESNLGLPELPPTGAAPEAAEVLEWLSGSHSVRVFADGPTKARFQVLDRLAERDVVVNGSQVWLYDSREKTAVHATVSADGESPHPGAGQANPVELAERLLAKLDSSTQVALGSNRNVAGRAAYALVLTPRMADTLVGSVVVAVDGETGMPLGVDVLARGQNAPAVSVAFTELSLETPEAALFEFTPPPGTTVTEHPSPDTTSDKPLLDPPAPSEVPQHSDKPEVAEPVGPEPTDPIVSGSDWATVVEVPEPGAADLLESPLFAQLTTAVDGGRLFSTALLNVLVTDDGRVFVGAVPVHLLQAAVTTQ